MYIATLKYETNNKANAEDFELSIAKTIFNILNPLSHGG
jgi:hypothetical protein